MCYWYTGCVAILVLDSSALVTLAAADALSLLRLSPHRAITATEVYRETVEAGVAGGYPDALAIGEAFDQGMVAVRDPRRGPAAGRRADLIVLLLAEEVQAAGVLINDQSLFRKAAARGLPAQVTAELVDELFRAGKLTRQHRDSLLEEFVARGRYTRQFLEAFRLLKE